ncbi:MAG TPA: methionine adenosyltransferase [Candidatus Saccharimonadales bacterium]|nr:methionine adenosyltransferase [Candidatus Saccharimonadales bacterium]
MPTVTTAESDADTDVVITKHIRLFTSESVCAGHPDKICDAISDAIVDAALAQDPKSRTGIETVAGANQINLYGEIKTTAKIDYEEIVRATVEKLGYTEPKWGFSQESSFTNDVHQQSPEIALGVDQDGAGDQGMMFGYACNETPELMPLPIALAHALARGIDEVRENGTLQWLRPDGKAQVTVRYEDDKPVAVEKVVAAVAHNEETPAEQVRKDTIDQVITPTLEKYGFKLPADEDIIVNGTGLWHIPGPESDAGLTGRKIVVDTYGGYARVGGGAFSGKDPSKVDRSGAYAARFIAKNIVAAGLATKCEVGLAYVIGQPKPLMQTIDTFGTATVSDEALHAFKDKLIDTSVKGIIERLDLARPIYSQTSAYGHFGKTSLPWEEIIAS